MNRRQFSLAASSLALAIPGLTLAAPSALLARMVAGPQRSPANRARDPYRHPAESLSFWGLAPGMTVIEVEPGGGYWAEILIPYLSATHGRYIGALGDEDGGFKARFADPALWGRVETTAFTPQSGPLSANGAADLVITARNFHNWMWKPGLVTKYLGDFHAALKPHGLLGVEEHRADPRPMVENATDGYVSTAYLVRKVQLAGFDLEAKSEVNANPKDDKNHPFGVWTLPPTNRSHARGQPTPADFDPAKYAAVGESDRMTLRFGRI